MNRRILPVLSSVLLIALGTGSVNAMEVAALRLVPFPKQVELGTGQFRLDRGLVIETPEAAETAIRAFVVDGLSRAGYGEVDVRVVPEGEFVIHVRISPESTVPLPDLREGAGEEDYALRVTRDGVTIVAPALPGLIHGTATLGQLVRANCQNFGIPCLTIQDWPSLRWRAFQDDITRGPSTRFSELKRDVTRGAMLKLNLFTYYMQHQFAFQKHPLLGPKGGSLTAGELSGLVKHGRPLGIQVLGNQQSFAHMQHTLAHPEYAHLKQDNRTLSPIHEGTYQLLDDLYSEVLPILPFEMFNVCCDETWGLGLEGPTKALGDEIGPGGVYVRHIRRVYDLVHGKYGKRMMMWGDVILNHPDKLEAIPKDVVMLTWGYSPKESFEDQIVPFANSGYEFFVCPGVNNWNRVLPDFRGAAVNIQNFVRDGAKHGAIGMLNTSWDDDGENLNGPNWYGFAWGAECAWNGSKTSLEDFNQRIGAVLVGEPGDELGRAIGLLSNPRVCGMMNRKFWEVTTGLVRVEDEASAKENLEITIQAIERLSACRQAATVDADLVDPLLFGAQRMGHYFESQIDRITAASSYNQAPEAKGDEAGSHLETAITAIRRIEQRCRKLRERWEELWLRENKPHALDWSLARYDAAIARCNDLLGQLENARKASQQGRPLPTAAEVGLRLWKRPDELVRPAKLESSLGNYQDYYPEFAFDGDPETFYWSDRGLLEGDHFTLTFDAPIALKRVVFLLGTNRYRQEYVHAGVLEAQAEDGSWQKLADLNSARVEVDLGPAKLKALRLRVAEPQRFWLIVREIEVE